MKVSTDNPWETSARERKTAALTALIVQLWQDVPALLRSTSGLDLWLAGFSPALRNALAAEAGIHAPSSDTWRRVCFRVQEYMDEQRRGTAG